MNKVNHIKKLTDNKHLNLFELDAADSNGRPFQYYLASRSKEIENLKITTKSQSANGVIIYSVYGERRDRIVLVRQYRYPIDAYIYEFPAGLVEEGEDFREAGIRELKEETGLELEIIDVSEIYERPYFTSIGMTDESCGTVYGYARGTPNILGLEDSEELEVVLADRQEVKRILREERVSIFCAYMLMHFIESEADPLTFLTTK